MQGPRRVGQSRPASTRQATEPVPGASSRAWPACPPRRGLRSGHAAAGTPRRPHPALLHRSSVLGPPSTSARPTRSPRLPATRRRQGVTAREPSPPAAERPSSGEADPRRPPALTGAGPARRSSGPSSDGKWRALLLLLMDGGATPATRGVSRNCFQGPRPHPLSSSRCGQAARSAYQTREAGRGRPPGDQSKGGARTNGRAP